MNIRKFSTENGIVLYQNYNIIKKLNVCSLVEYNNVYGMKKVAIIHNNFNKIIYNAENSKDYRINNTLEKYETLFSQIKKRKTIELFGEFQFNAKEYITNFPYKLQLSAKESSMVISTLDGKVSNAIKTIQKGTDVQYRMIRFRHTEIEVLGEKIIIYHIDEVNERLIELSNEIKFDKSSYYYKNSNTIDSKLDDCIICQEDEDSKRIKRKYEKKNSKIISYKIDDEKNKFSKLENKSKEITSDNKTILGLELELISSHMDSNRVSNSTDLDDNLQNINRKSRITQETYKYENDYNKMGSLEPEKKQRSFNVTSRNLTIVKYIKNLYQQRCQICGVSIEISNNQYLCEVHHIKPLGLHKGADVIENMIVLCPNHHVMFDRGVITIDVEKKKVIHFNQSNPLNNKDIELKHEISENYIDYHNNSIFNSIDNDENILIDSKRMNSLDKQIVNYDSIVTLQDVDTKESFNIKIENKFNKQFMKLIEKILINRVLDDIVDYDEFQYKIISIKNSTN